MAARDAHYVETLLPLLRNLPGSRYFQQLGLQTAEAFLFQYGRLVAEQINGMYLRVVIRSGASNDILAAVHKSMYLTRDFERKYISVAAGSAMCALMNYREYDPRIQRAAFPRIYDRADHVPRDSFIFDDLGDAGLSGNNLHSVDIPLLTNTYNGLDVMHPWETCFTEKRVEFTWTPEVLQAVASGQLELCVGVREVCCILSAAGRRKYVKGKGDGHVFRVCPAHEAPSHAVIESETASFQGMARKTPTLFTCLVWAPFPPFPASLSVTYFSREKFFVREGRFWCWKDWGVTSGFLPRRRWWISACVMNPHNK